jgi:hypothetical protein
MIRTLLATSALLAVANAQEPQLRIVATLAAEAPSGADVRIAAPAKGKTQSTSLRTKTKRELRDGQAERDRDLGQTFTTGDASETLERITVLLGPDEIKEGVLGSAVSVQLFEVGGTPKINDNGTTTGKVAPGTDDPRADDFIEGETFKSLGVASGARLPALMKPGQFLTLSFVGKRRLLLKPGTQYGFLIVLDEPAEGRALPLATEYWGNYSGGHGIRREGVPAFPTDMKARSEITPGTKGFPDVDTWRDLVFYIESEATK